jgi:tetratricopeptide (TPR) repeat protein
VDAPAGTIVLVRDTALRRGAVAREQGTTVLSVGAAPGEAYRPRAWETNRDVYALLDAGRDEDARQLLLDALERYEDTSTLYYNLACAEAKLGEADAALDHLALAVAGEPALAAAARGDHDLDSLRADPRFDARTASA